MAGSLRWFIYEDDDDNQYAVLLDENVGGFDATGFQPYEGGVALDPLPIGFKMRYVNAVQRTGAGAGFRYRRVYCGTADSDLFSGEVSNFILNNLGYTVTSTRGEKQRRPLSGNSGLEGQSSTVGVSEGTT